MNIKDEIKKLQEIVEENISDYDQGRQDIALEALEIIEELKTNKIERDCPAEESAEEWNTTDIKEEKDIWKPMAEITMADSYLFRFDNTKAIMALTQGINEFNGFRNRLRDALIKESDIEACTLTDFINDYERLKADVAAIKKQLDL